MLHSYGLTEIGKLMLTDRVDFLAEDTIGPGCAAPAGILPHANHPFRLLIRKNMFEFYVDDMLVQTFNTTHAPGSTDATPQQRRADGSLRQAGCPASFRVSRFQAPQEQVALLDLIAFRICVPKGIAGSSSFSRQRIVQLRRSLPTGRIC